ncbi:hypothetical protein P154DRAFT_300114 [Amniculicola lignicola CBS 123094]|uniref:Uncharacterized protein n=1 Tax=Amniculicola lignicola CBS 123094 TaxID=1392246 RepID=A0A6A5WCX0_9PLEO|nr:hypothetical protein P154DRAFT_300114 [Amniculicola lignicola CBS 123094]
MALLGLPTCILTSFGTVSQNTTSLPRRSIHDAWQHLPPKRYSNPSNRAASIHLRCGESSGCSVTLVTRDAAWLFLATALWNRCWLVGGLVARACKPLPPGGLRGRAAVVFTQYQPACDSCGSHTALRPGRLRTSRHYT